MSSSVVSGTPANSMPKVAVLKGDIIAFCVSRRQCPPWPAPSSFTIGAVTTVDNPAVFSVVPLVEGQLGRPSSRSPETSVFICEVTRGGDQADRAELAELREQEAHLAADIARGAKRIEALEAAICSGTAALAVPACATGSVDRHERQVALREVQAVLATGGDWEVTRGAGGATKALVCTVEGAAVLGGAAAAYADLAAQPDLLQRLSAVPVGRVRARDVAAAERSLAQYAKAAKELPLCAQLLRRWMQAMIACWRDAHASAGGTELARGRRSASADAMIAPQLERDRQELKEQQEIRALAEAELAAVRDMLEGHAALAGRRVAAVRVELPWVLCELTRHISAARWQQWQELPEGSPLTLPEGAARALRQALAAPSTALEEAPAASGVGPSATATAAVTEVELLQEELQACRADLQRVTRERDALLYSKRSHRSVGRTAGHADPSGERVDRSIADELEEQLHMAYGRIKELETKAAAAPQQRSPRTFAPPSPLSGRTPGTVTFAGVPPLALSRDGPLTPRAAPPEPQTILVPPSAPPLPPLSFAGLETSADRSELRGSQQRALRDRVAQLERELDAQQRLSTETNEQLNAALNAQAEAQLRADQLEREVEAMWGKLEDAEARLHDEMESGDRRASAAPLPPAQGRTEVSFSMPTVLSADGKAPSPPLSYMPRMTTNAVPRAGASRSAPSPSRRDSYVSASVLGRESRAPAPSISLQPVEQLTPIELRHEVRVLRQEVERHLSIELRLTNELQLVRERQREERRRRQDAREARLQMLTRLQEAVQEAMVKPEEEVVPVQVLLESTRLECSDSATKRRLSLHSK